MSGSIRVDRIPGGPLWRITSSYFSRKLIEHAKAVPGMRYDPKPPSWVGYVDAVRATCARLESEGVRVSNKDDLPEPDSWKKARMVIPFATAGLRDYQIEGVQFLITRAEEGALLADGMRLGKAQAVDEPVLTPTGWRPIGNLRAGDHVIGASGRPVRVTGVYPQGQKQVFKVTMTDGAETRCCTEHLWGVRTPKDKYAGRPGRVMSLTEIMNAGLVQPGTTNRRWFVPICPAPEFESSELLELDPYLLGALLANGSLTRRVEHSGGRDQQELLSACLPYEARLRKASGYGVTICPRVKFDRRNVIRDALNGLNLIGTYSETKFVPHEYLFASSAMRLTLLQGLCDNDGTVSEDGLTVEYNTTSPQLAADVLYLVRSLGGVAWLSTRTPMYTYKGERLTGQLDHRVRMSLPPDVVPFQLPRKVLRFKPRSKFLPAHAIDAITPDGVAECVCISVDAPDGLYVTRDFIVTHNTAQSLTAARAFKKKTLVICPSHVVGVWGRPKGDVHGAGEISKWWPDAWRGGLLSGVEGDLGEKGDLPGTTDPGVVCLESVKPAKAQAVIERLAKGETKTRALGPAESRALDNARAEIEAFADKIKHANVIVCHYDIVYAWVHVLLLWGFETLILDECHVLAGWQSRRAQSLKVLRAATKYMIGLTGTPVTNLPRHTHNVLEILAPLRFGYFFLPNKEDGTERASYARLFCGSHQETVGTGEATKTFWVHDGRLNLDVPDGEWAIVKEETLAERLKHLMLRRIKKDVDPQLPNKTRQIIDVVIPARHVIGMSEASLSKEYRTILNSAADGKLKDVVRLVAGHTDEREKVLCFCYRRLFAERVASDLGKKVSADTMIVWVHGDLPQKERDKRISALRNHAGPGVLCCTIDTTSTGIDLSFASVAVFAELTWEPHELAQCLDAKTEILTPHGFVPIGTVCQGDAVAAFNLETEELAYLPALNIVDRALGPNEKMFGVVKDRLNIRVTGDHRIVLGEPHSGWGIETAATASRRSQKYRIPVAGYMKCVGVPLTDDELCVLGWYLTDGSWTGNTLSIGQSVGSAVIAEIEKCLVGAGLDYTTSYTKAGTGSRYRRNWDQRHYHIPKFSTRAGGMGWYKLAPYLDKNLSPLLFAMTREQLAVLLEAIHWGDGNKEAHQPWTRRTYHITTGNQVFAERLQRLCIERGFRANLKRYQSPYYKKARPPKVLKGSMEILPSGRVSARMPNKMRLGTFATVQEARRALKVAIAQLPAREMHIPPDVDALFKRTVRKYAFTINIGMCNWRTVEGTSTGRTNIRALRVHRQPGRAERVWCVSNAWGTLVIRRGGRTAIVGNCEERLYKFGADAKALIQYVIARGTGDELILRAVIDKLDTFERVVGSTGDAMKEELAGKKEDGMKRLYAALVEMQRAAPVKEKRKVKRKASV